MALSEKDLSEGQGRLPDQTGEDTEFLDYVLILFRYRWLIFWTVSLCTAGIVTYASVQEPEYQATATIYSERQDISTAVLYADFTKRNVVRKLYQYELDGETHIIDLTEILGAGSEQCAVRTLHGMVRIIPGNHPTVNSIIVTSRSPQLSAIVANEYVVQILQNKYDNLRRSRRDMHAIPGKDSVAIREIDSFMNKFEKWQMRMDTVGVEGFQGGDSRVLSLAVPPETPVEKYRINVVIASGLAIGLSFSILLVFLIEYVGRKRGLLGFLTNELKKDVDWVSSRLDKK